MVSYSFFKNTLLFSLILLAACGNSVNTKMDNSSNTVAENKKAIVKIPVTQTIKTGADNYEHYLPLLRGKKVGIVTNQTGIITVRGKQEHLVDFLLEKNIALQKIYAPEHGFRGTADAGELIKDGKDTKTGLPIVSLYGNNKKPKPEQLIGIDILVFDLQDVGARFYTYISSLHYVMEACADNNIPLVVLDRPNPNGSIVDGPVLEMEYKSFVGMHPIPVLHGMTIGEYARMINGEEWLQNNVRCNLAVIPCTNYNRSMPYNLPVKPSPNLPNSQAINLYPSLCFFEGTTISVGRGTNMQFQIYGAPFLPKTNFSFTPMPNEGAKGPKHNGKVCYGEDLTKITPVTQLELKWLINAYEKANNNKTEFFTAFFTKLAGTKQLQEQIEAGKTENEIRESWKEGLTAFKLMREKYLIY
ncbi:exo-beta-N-acetylmuramidase NamZ family protein [Flavobacterium litorale]|uniref:DUF1343 domain-containing protein n=1 Tax=Flavobacterium litorale TaxID=2856519 RepID=A0ABX8V7R1_9FLAO|nr:DUF1343 domain-containing protein [Flavobacterium litorale]QYJ68537.1 DUF1343 domain-containing protein [Flavobacterium litorale]